MNEGVERMLTLLPSDIIVAKLTPPGIESSMMVLSKTVIIFNQFVLRNIIGALINSTFIGITTSNINEIYQLY